MAGQKELSDVRERCGALESTASNYEAQIRSLEEQVGAAASAAGRAAPGLPPSGARAAQARARPAGLAAEPS